MFIARGVFFIRGDVLLSGKRLDLSRFGISLASLCAPHGLRLDLAGRGIVVWRADIITSYTKTVTLATSKFGVTPDRTWSFW